MIKTVDTYSHMPTIEEHVVLLSDDGEEIGIAPKLATHHSNTPLHLAFSVYIVNKDNQVLVTRRAESKKVWPGVWTGSCCGHPARKESMAAAIRRRVNFELGISVSELDCLLPEYRYKTPPYKGIIEHEVCPVYIARSDDQPEPNMDEVCEYRWLSWQALIKEALADDTNKWSWWCKDQLKQLQGTGLV